MEGRRRKNDGKLSIEQRDRMWRWRRGRTTNRFDLSDVKCIKEREGGDDGNSSTKNLRRDGWWGALWMFYDTFNIHGRPSFAAFRNTYFAIKLCRSILLLLLLFLNHESPDSRCSGVAKVSGDRFIRSLGRKRVFLARVRISYFYLCKKNKKK